MAVFVLLPLAVFTLFELVPLVQALYYALTDWAGYSPDMNFVGLTNFAAMFSDPLFMKSLRNSVILAAVVPTITLVCSFVIAAVVTTGGPSTGRIQGLKGSGFYRVVSFFPYCVPAIVIGIIWSQIYDPQRGLLNGLLSALGFDFQGFPWLGKVDTAMPASIMVIIWGSIGFYTVLFVAAIKGIPAELYEAARMDGAGRFRSAISVTLPNMLSSLQTGYIYLGLMAIDAFIYMVALNPLGGPDYSTWTMTQNLYNTAFFKGKFGYSTAQGVALAIVTLAYAGIIALIFRLARGRDDGTDRA
ncbi:MAG: sugar ABC transporter permease [Propionibacteriaceae bacterium]|nr:sugar ABC transporter permease [Propionibacteriaceae bacterium]